MDGHNQALISLFSFPFLSSRGKIKVRTGLYTYLRIYTYTTTT